MLLVLVATLCIWAPFSDGRVLSLMDIQSIVDDFGDEILTHQNLNSASPLSRAEDSTLDLQDIDHVSLEMQHSCTKKASFILRLVSG